MQKIPVMLAKADMILARDVYRGEGQVGIPVCGKGTTLTDALISRLERMDVQTVYVEGHPIWENNDRSLDDLLRDLEKRFEKVKDDPLTSRLFETYKAYLIKSMGDDGERQAE